VRLFKCFLDAAVSEQIARRVTMKSATENADEMIKSLSMQYNRARQAQITKEIAEVIGGGGGPKERLIRSFTYFLSDGGHMAAATDGVKTAAAQHAGRIIQGDGSPLAAAVAEGKRPGGHNDA